MDKWTHFYRIVVRPDNTFDVYIDDKLEVFGHLEDHFEFIMPKKIKDPKIFKPADWVDE